MEHTDVLTRPTSLARAQALKPGDRVAVLSISSPADPAALELGLDVLRFARELRRETRGGYSFRKCSRRRKLRKKAAIDEGQPANGPRDPIGFHLMFCGKPVAVAVQLEIRLDYGRDVRKTPVFVAGRGKTSGPETIETTLAERL